MHDKTLLQLSHALKSKAISSEELTLLFLDRCHSLNAALNCFITINDEQALRQARNADKEIQQGDPSPLAGVPLAHKDIFCTAGVKTSCASGMLDNFHAPYDATVVEKLNQAGMVTLGKTNMDEFAMGSSTETSYYGPAANPWNKDHVPGGSSGGSAAAVAACMVPAATATDTGGSIRQPASFCGVTGLKPTYGLVSRYGMIAFASSLDQAGPMTRTAQDAALLLNHMAGFDQRDSTSMQQRPGDYTASLGNPIEGLKIGVPKEYFGAELDSGVATLIQDGLKQFERQGAIIQDVQLLNTHLAIPAYYVVASAECSSNLARYDGVRFGHRCKNPKDLMDLFCRSRGEGFGSEVKRRIMIGTYALSAGYYDAYYIKAQQIRRLIKQDFECAFKDVDLILSPTTPGTAFKKKERMDDPVTMYLSDRYTVAVNLAGLPAISIPVGFKNELPVGMQLIGPYFREALLLNAAHQYQLNTDWHLQVPGAFQ